MELNRILRPGGFFIWSATPVYRDDERDQNVWKGLWSIIFPQLYIVSQNCKPYNFIIVSLNFLVFPLFLAAVVALTEAMCWKEVAKSFDSSGIGLVIYQKPISSSCYGERKENNPPLCDQNTRQNGSWYLSACS